MHQTFAALGEPTRFRIVELLRAGAHPVGKLGTLLPLPQPQVSKHLRVLREAGLVQVELRAQQRLYSLRAETWEALHTWLQAYRQLWDERFRALDRVLLKLQSQTNETTSTITNTPTGSSGRKPRRRLAKRVSKPRKKA